VELARRIDAIVDAGQPNGQNRSIR
jgi:hypothetical protein